MKPDYPACGQVPQLKKLWQLAFGDSPDFIDLFFTTAYAPTRCRCLTVGGHPASVLYWLDCSCRGAKMAYLYAVATHPDHQGRGLCRMLMEDTHQLLQTQGYTASLLVPGEPGLRKMYAKMGYAGFGGIREFSAAAGRNPVPIRQLSREEYAALRRAYLPPNSVLQENGHLAYLETFAQFYAGEDFLLSASAAGDSLHGLELLGDPSTAPGILAALGLEEGSFRTPGADPFAMYRPLSPRSQPPAYFGLALD